MPMVNFLGAAGSAGAVVGAAAGAGLAQLRVR